ncbi:AfsR/SARP family transcriptional regulator [Nonomuraea longicatena]|uniref:OmpR/PhoB-type domain-containing protein n=1 Tax=Nonomuraea longicatena TaxID=83682 RepID=A0ABN1Q1C5_9ACTN
MRFSLLGEVRVSLGATPVPTGHARQRNVLAALLVHANHAVPVDRLIDRVWDDPPAQARGTLYSYLSRLRRTLAAAGGVGIERRTGGYLLTVDPAAVDLHRFRDLVSRAGAARDDAAAPLFAEALGLWRGEPFSGLTHRWLDGLRETLYAERLAAELAYTEVRLRRGEHAHLTAELAGRAARHPLDERAAGQYMLALYRGGRTADALSHYRDLRARLTGELGIDPGADLRELHQRILTADPDLLAPPPGARPVPRRSDDVVRALRAIL